MRRELRVIDTGAGEPCWNMAVDAALLEGGCPATLRFYRWSPPALSLGRFQAPAQFADVQGPHVLVRRVTGGGAIYHDRELTWSLALDAELLPPETLASYVLVHGAIQRALRAIGVPARMLASAARHRARPSERWCFLDPGVPDLVTPDGRKLVGSAQRRPRRPQARVLQHGSIVLSAPLPTPGCGAIGDYVDASAAAALLPALVQQEIGTALELQPSPGTLAVSELALAAALLDTA